MDPLTHGALAAALPQATFGKNMSALRIGALGFLAGMAPDLDVFLRSTTDPLAFLEYHRQFTHALIFIPFGGLMSALVLHWVLGRRWGLAFRQTLIACTLGYATHALLDAATAYGTLLLWPFSDVRVAVSNISIIDPLFTLPLMAGVALAVRRKSPVPARIGLAWAAFYLSLGLILQSRAVATAERAATERGVVPVHIAAKPSFGNLLVWKTITETSDRYYIDAVRTDFSNDLIRGRSLAKLDLARDLPWLDAGTQQAKDIERFRRFSQGYLAMDPEQPHRIIDVRYSFVPNEVRPLWAVDVSPDAAPDAHAVYMTDHSNAREDMATLWRMAIGRRN